MFLMLKHVDEENSKYPASAEHTVLTKQKKKHFISQHSSDHTHNRVRAQKFSNLA